MDVPSFPRKRESSRFQNLWIPACAGMTLHAQRQLYFAFAFFTNSFVYVSSSLISFAFTSGLKVGMTLSAVHKPASEMTPSGEMASFTLLNENRDSAFAASR